MSTNREKLVASAQKYVEKGQNEKAIKEYLKAVSDDDKDVRIWLKIGDLYAKINRRDEAVEVYQKVARFYSDQGFYLKAVAVFKQILKLDPRLMQINIKLAELYKQLGLLSDAMVQYEAVAAQLGREGKSKEALAAIKQIVELDPENVDNRMKLAELYARESMNREAIDEFARAAEQLHERKRWDEYLRVAERLLFFSADNRPVSKEVARLYIERGDARRALPRLQVCFKADARDTDVLWLLARAFESLEQIPKAVTVLRELARIYAENNDGRNRDEAHRKLLQLSPGDPEAERALSGKPRTLSQPLAESAVVIQAPSTSRGGRGQTPTPEDPTHVHPANVSVSISPLVAPAVGPDDEAISKILDETDVYIKYKLFPKAIEHVQKIFDRDPKNHLAREKLKALYLSMGRNEDALGELWHLVELSEPSRSRRFLREILELSPHDARALRVLQQLPSTTPVPTRESVDDIEELPGDDLVETSSYNEDLYEIEPSEPTHDVDDGDEVRTGVIDSSHLVDGGNVDDDLIPLVIDALPDQTKTAEVRIVADRFALPEDSANDLAKNLPTAPRGKSQTVGNPPTGDHDLHTRFENPLGRFEPAGDSLSDELEDLPPSPQVVRSSTASQPELADPTHQSPFPVSAIATQETLLPRDSLSSVAAGSDGSSALDDDLEEADFFLQQSLFTAAKATLETMLKEYPDHPLILGKLREVMLARGGGPAPHEDLMAATSQGQLDRPPPPLREERSGPLEVAPTTLPKRGVIEKGVDAEDYETHYDLGIAYKEMGLVDDALVEFRIAMQSAKKEVQCLLMLGLCYLQKGQPAEAVSQFKKGLYAETISDRESLTLYFELGQAYEQMNDLREALYYFEKVSKREANFRNVDKKLEQVQLGTTNAPQKSSLDEMDFDDALDALGKK